MPRRFALTLILAMGLAGCAGASPLTWVTTAGKSLHSLRTAADTVAIVVFDPATCFACETGLADWARAKRQHATDVVLVLSRQPDQFASNLLKLQRVNFDGILRTSRGSGPQGVPAEYLIVHDELVAVRERRGRRTNERLLDEFLTSRSSEAVH